MEKNVADLGAELNAWCGCQGAGQPYESYIPTAESEKWTQCIPVVPLKVAAGAFSEVQAVFEVLNDAGHRAKVPDGVRPERGMYIAQIVGKSMEPEIPDRSYALFRPMRAGTREGRCFTCRRVLPACSRQFARRRARCATRRLRSRRPWRHELNEAFGGFGKAHLALRGMLASRSFLPR